MRSWKKLWSLSLEEKNEQSKISRDGFFMASLSSANLPADSAALLPKKGKAMAGIKRRDSLKQGTMAAVTSGAGLVLGGTQEPFTTAASNRQAQKFEGTVPTARKFNGPYREENLNRLAFPLGGIGAGMVCLEGNGTISHVSVRNTPDVFNEPFMFSAISVKDYPKSAKVLEGPLPSWKIFGGPGAGNGAGGTSYGFPRFEKAFFVSRFPFGTVYLEDEDMPLSVQIAGWSSPSFWQAIYHRTESLPSRKLYSYSCHFRCIEK
jgi:hypothetical protein